MPVRSARLITERILVPNTPLPTARASSASGVSLLEQTRREIDLQVRLAKKEMLEHAADLSVQLATERIKSEVTPADQDRMVDRYLSQVKEQR